MYEILSCISVSVVVLICVFILDKFLNLEISLTFILWSSVPTNVIYRLTNP